MDRPRQEGGLEKVETKPALPAKQWLVKKGDEYANKAEDSSATEEYAKRFGRIGEIFDKTSYLIRTNVILDAEPQDSLELEIVFDIADSSDEKMDTFAALQIATFIHSLPTEKGK